MCIRDRHQVGLRLRIRDRDGGFHFLERVEECLLCRRHAVNVPAMIRKTKPGVGLAEGV